MNLFEPRTFSTDWEIMVIDKLDRFVDTEKLWGFAGILRSEMNLPVQIDWNTVEFALGINSSFDQIWTSILRLTDRASQLMREYDLDLFPAAAHPMAPMFNSSHIHVGTIQDESMGIYMENILLKYVPVFGALAANSPASDGRVGEFKSYRIRHMAHGCTQPGSARNPHMTQLTWGTDSLIKMYSAPTFEVRITDCSSSRRFAAELATFVAAFVHHLGTRAEEYMPSPEEYRDCMTNRWAAAKHGLQATLMWDGRATPVVEILDSMLDECTEELSILGVKRNDLYLIDAMIEKRFCQADYVLGLTKRYPDPFAFSSVYAKLMRHWDTFDRYIESAPALDPIAIPSEEEIMEEHLSFIGEETHFYRSRQAMSYPPAVADSIVDRMVQLGLVKRESTLTRGTVLTRI